MDELFEQPHTAKVTQPERSRSASTNVGELKYTVPPAAEISVKCMLQFRSGSRGVLTEGAVYPIDAIMYTTDSRMQMDDLVEPQTPAEFASFKFVVTGIMPKTDVDGNVRHLQCQLTRSQRT